MADAITIEIPREAFIKRVADEISRIYMGQMVAEAVRDLMPEIRDLVRGTIADLVAAPETRDELRRVARAAVVRALAAKIEHALRRMSVPDARQLAIAVQEATSG